MKTETQWQALIAFFRARRGKAVGFRFKDWSDYKVESVQIGVGDDSTTEFQLVKIYSSGPVAVSRDITKPVAGSVDIYVDSILQSSGVSVDTATGIVTFTTPPAMDEVITADFEFDVPVRFDTDEMTVNNVPHEMRVVKTDMEANGVMKLDAVAEDISSYDFYTPPGETSSNIEPPVLVPETIVQFIDAPPLPTDTIPNQGLLRIGVAADGSSWNGSAVYRSDDGGEAGGNTFTLLAGLDGAATFGAIITNLPDGPFETWDEVGEVEVILTSGSLASVSELAVFNGANAALIGDPLVGYELVQFQNAQLIGENTYKLTRLLRGRQGTEWAIDGHTAGDRFILITPALYTTAIANNLIGRELYYKAVSVGNTLTTTDELAFTYTGRNLKPFAPVHVKGTRNGSGDLTIDWIRRSRVDAEWRDGVGIPLGEESEAYEVDILDGGNVVRTIEVTSPTASYSATDQATDFGSAQSSVDVNIYQLSAVVGRGYAASATI